MIAIKDPFCHFCNSKNILIISTAIRGIYDLKAAENRAAVSCLKCGRVSIKQLGTKTTEIYETRAAPKKTRPNF